MEIVVLDDIIKKLKQTYNNIKEESNLLEETIKIHVVCNVFLKEMGYDTTWPACGFEEKKANTFADIFLKNNSNNVGLIIETKKCEYVISEIDIIQLADYVRNRNVEYGLLTNGKDYVIINTNIRTAVNYKEDMLRHQVVFWFNIFDSKSKNFTHHDFFRFLSKVSLFDTNLIGYFKDVAQFKAIKFPDNNSSWYTYKSTLYRFFEHYADTRNRYYPGILEEVRVIDFENFIKYKRNLTIESKSSKNIVTDNAIKNNYSHISSMLNTLVESPFGGIGSTHFDKGREKSIADIISGSSSKEYQSIDNQTFKQAVDFYFSKKMGIRDLAIFLLCCCYGLERNKVQKIKWVEISIKKNNSYIKIDGRDIQLNPLLVSCLKYLKSEKEKKKIKTEFVFVTFRNGKYNNASITTVNTVFDQLIEISDNEKWRNFSPQFARTSLIIKLFDSGYSLDEIIYITGIPVKNIGNYIKSEKIIERAGKSGNKILISEVFGEVLNQIF